MLTSSLQNYYHSSTFTLLAVPTYRVLHPYDPQNDGDLALKTGDWVTLEDTPYGGGWWKGSVDDRSGWFPKTYVEYVDREAEKKKKQEGECG